ncbi:unnamed protein product [Ambrosiozyma monospora]|uniref:Unnamed protein product n=1 Tax=Ambrosiozyma monospora TaxID=43982 RepID=A0ACB5T6B8_AMBMO|nr:unnamed protein product [Ambrosiozyma monospora]
MGKRKVKRSVEVRQNKRQKQEDSKLDQGLFNKYSVGDNDSEDDDFEGFDESEEEENNGQQFDDDDEEQDYELKPRSFKENSEDLVEGLPIRSLDESQSC